MTNVAFYIISILLVVLVALIIKNCVDNKMLFRQS